MVCGGASEPERTKVSSGACFGSRHGREREHHRTAVEGNPRRPAQKCGDRDQM
jgi:hypothetical protein